MTGTVLYCTAPVGFNACGTLNSVMLRGQGLTGLLQAPIRGAERHGLPGMLSGTN